MKIYSITLDEFDKIWPIIESVVRGGETYALPVDLSREQALTIWSEQNRRIYVAEDRDGILGTYYLRPNQPGPGSHVANAGYMTALASRGRGVARALCLHSLEEARQLGFSAMQFNCVVAQNAPAVHLWTTLGFKTIGRLPQAFRMPDGQLVDALVMHQHL